MIPSISKISFSMITLDAQTDYDAVWLGHSWRGESQNQKYLSLNTQPWKTECWYFLAHGVNISPHALCKK